MTKRNALMPAGEIACTKSAEWFDVGIASEEFRAGAGDDIVLISIEVARPEMRIVEANFQVKGVRSTILFFMPIRYSPTPPKYIFHLLHPIRLTPTKEGAI